MALTMTNYGSYNVSGAALKTKLDTLTLVGDAASGAAVHIIPIGFGQVQLIKVDA